MTTWEQRVPKVLRAVGLDSIKNRILALALVATLVPALSTIFTGVFNGEQGLRFPAETPPAFLGAYFQPERWLAWIALVATLLTSVRYFADRRPATRAEEEDLDL